MGIKAEETVTTLLLTNETIPDKLKRKCGICRMCKNSADVERSRGISMGRAGAGGGGHRSSGGGHSFGRSGGGHQIGGSRSRAGSGSRMSSSNRMGSGGYTPPRYRMYRRYRHYGYGGDYYVGAGIGAYAVMIIVVMVWILIMAVVMGAFRGFGDGSYNSVKSTIVRERLDTGKAYMNDCIIDEIGWFQNPSKTAAELKSFWEETGVQPFIILKAYDAALKTKDQKEQWALDYYDANFDTENIFLYVYFAEKDTDNDVGYMAYANGFETSSVMDAEAVEIFWNYLDRYWTSDMDTDDVFISTFNNTAKAIMHVSATKTDVMVWGIILAVVIVVAVAVVSVIKMRHKRAKEKAEEDARILNTPVGDIAADNLEDKYLKKD